VAVPGSLPAETLTISAFAFSCQGLEDLGPRLKGAQVQEVAAPSYKNEVLSHMVQEAQFQFLEPQETPRPERPNSPQESSMCTCPDCFSVWRIGPPAALTLASPLSLASQWKILELQKPQGNDRVTKRDTTELVLEWQPTLGGQWPLTS
jgi:hypothetical protein